MRPDTNVPASIGHYQVEGLIGAGGMGVVYKARDTRLDRPVAIKAISDRVLLQDRTAMDRLRREARAAAQLDHPHVCRVYELVETGTDVYLVMEYVEGETLHDRLVRGPMPPSDALRFAAEIAEGLADVHARGLVHRDIKPGNIIITTHGHVKILDFGLVHRDMESPKDAPTMEMRQTSVAGTPHYMAPEQSAGRPVTPRADVYAVGVVLFECLTGKLPFQDNVPLAIAVARVATPDVAPIVAKCLHADPAARYEHAGALAADLRTLIRPTTAEPWWRRRDGMIAIAATLAAAVVALWSLSRPPSAGSTFDLDHFDKEPSAEFDSRISPDGKLVSFISNRRGGGQLFVKEVAGTGAPIHVATGVSDVVSHVWSPDGSECAAIVRMPGAYRGVLQVFRATFGGTPRVSIELDRELTAFRASRWVDNTVYIEAKDRTRDIVLLLAVPVAAGATPVEVSATWQLPGALVNIDVDPIGSKAVLALKAGGQEDLAIVSLAAGSASSPLTNDAFTERRPIWSGRSTVVFQSNQNGQTDLWELDIRTKTRTPVLTGPEEETAESASADGSVITLKQFSVVADLWAINEPGQASRELTAGTLGSFAPSMSADGRVIAVQRPQPSADRGGPFEDSVVESGTYVDSGLLATTKVDEGALPVVSPDGSQVAYLQKTGDTFRLLVRTLAKATSAIVSSNARPAGYIIGRLDWTGRPFCWSPDSRTLYFLTLRGELNQFTAPSGPVARLAQEPGVIARDPVVSPDGKSLAYLSSKGRGHQLHVLDLASGSTTVSSIAGEPPGAMFGRGWTRDGRWMVLVREATARDEDATVTAEILLADATTSRLVATVGKVFAATAYFDSERGAVYLTQAQPTGHRVVSVSLATGAVTGLKQTSNPRVTFSGFSTAKGAPVIGVQDERRTDVWLARRR